MVVAPESLPGLNAKQLREIVTDLIAQAARNGQEIRVRGVQIDECNLHIHALDQQIASKDREIVYRQAKIDQLTHEMAVLKRWKFGRSREQLDAGQASLLDETIDADIAAIPPCQTRCRFPMIADDPHWSATYDNKSTFN